MACSLEKADMFNPAKARLWIDKNRKGQYSPVICRQCKNAPCIKACPVEEDKPLYRDEETGVVLYRAEACTRCYACVEACPFGAMRIDPETEFVFKCDLCGGDPECVKWCPTGAISFPEEDEKIEEGAAKEA